MQGAVEMHGFVDIIQLECGHKRWLHKIQLFSIDLFHLRFHALKNFGLNCPRM